jgi:alkylhydroperoxidase family enzyme
VSEHLERLREIAERPTPPALEPYLAKVRERAYAVTDDDVAALKAEGFGDDEIFEATVVTAIREGLRRLDAAERVIG